MNFNWKHKKVHYTENLNMVFAAVKLKVSLSGENENPFLNNGDKSPKGKKILQHSKQWEMLNSGDL